MSQSPVRTTCRRAIRICAYANEEQKMGRNFMIKKVAQCSSALAGECFLCSKRLCGGYPPVFLINDY